MLSNMVTAEEKEDQPEEVEEMKNSGFVQKRKTTDVLCTILWFVHVLVFLVVSFMGMADGNPSKLFSPRDYQGAYCGVKTNWNNGPNLENQPKLGFMMNVSKTTDVIAKQLMCSTTASNYLLSSAAGLTAQEQADYLCECCLSPCAKCAGSLSLGGDITGAISLGDPFAVVNSRMADLTNPANAMNLFSPSGANGDMFSNIWNEATQYFIQVCLPTCEPDINTLNATAREYTYTPDPDNALSFVWDKLLSAPGASSWSSSFKYKAFHESICPYSPSHCVPFPGIKYAEISNGYCTFQMASDVIDAVGSVAASAFESLGGDSFASSATETFGMWVGDFEKSIDSFVIVAILCFVIGLVYLVILRFTVKFCVWFAVAAIMIALLLGGGFAYVRSHQCKDTGFFDTATQTGVAVVVAGTSAVSNAVSGQEVSEDCTGDCANYRGVQTRTRSGKLCQNWDVQSPHSHTYTSAAYPNSGLAQLVNGNNVSTNYCRNPYHSGDVNKASTIWCFTTDSGKRWELCTPIGVIRPACQHGYAVAGENMRTALEISSYVIWGLAGVWLLLVFCFVNRIRLAVSLNQVAAAFVKDTPRILIVPIVQAIVGTIWVLVWMLSAAFLLSQVPDSYTPMGAYETYDIAYGTSTVPGKCTDRWPTGSVWKEAPELCRPTANTTTAAACWRCAPPRYIFDVRFGISFFSFLWNNAFMIALGQCIIAGAVGIWFFTPNSKKGELGGCEAIRKSNWNVWRYHVGSLAFGSFIIALVQFIRYLMKYFEKNAEAQKNAVLALVLRVAQCCLHCFERFLEFLNKNAYIQIAIRGTPFCTSAKTAFKIIMQNFLRFGTVAMLGYVIHVIGYVFIMASTLVVGYFILKTMHSDISPVIPMIVYAFLSYLVGKLYMNVFGLAVDTALQCVIFAEEKCPDGNFVPPELQSVIDKSKAGKAEEEE